MAQEPRQMRLSDWMRLSKSYNRDCKQGQAKMDRKSFICKKMSRRGK